MQLIDYSVVPDNAIRKYPDFGLVGGPVWSQEHGALRPCCFAKGTTEIGLRATVQVTDGPHDELTLVAEASDPNLRFQGTLTNQSGVHDVELSRVSGSLEDRVKEVSFTLEWSYKTGSTWVPIGTTEKVSLYQIVAIGGLHWDLGMHIACNYVDGQNDAALAICQGIARDLSYAPGLSSYGPGLRIYTGDREGNCYAHADVMLILCSSIGIAATKEFTWGGESHKRNHYLFDKRREPTIRMRAPATDKATKNPHFLHHVQVNVGGRILDPAYGTVGRATVTETGCGAVAQYGDDLPARRELCDWTCPH